MGRDSGDPPVNVLTDLRSRTQAVAQEPGQSRHLTGEVGQGPVDPQRYRLVHRAGVLSVEPTELVRTSGRVTGQAVLMDSCSPVDQVPGHSQHPRHPGSAQHPAAQEQSRDAERLQAQNRPDVEVHGFHVVLTQHKTRTIQKTVAARVLSEPSEPEPPGSPSLCR